MVKEIKEFSEFKSIIEGKELSVIDFYADWCGPCRVIAPKFVELAETTEGVVFAKVNVDNLEKAAEFANVTAMPTFKFYKNNEEIKEIIGADLAEIKKTIEANR